MLDNLDVNDIAARCAISARTVRAHLEHVYKKLGLRHRSDLLLLVLAEVLAGPACQLTAGVRDSGMNANGARASLKRVE